MKNGRIWRSRPLLAMGILMDEIFMGIFQILMGY